MNLFSWLPQNVSSNLRFPVTLVATSLALLAACSDTSHKEHSLAPAIQTESEGALDWSQYGDAEAQALITECQIYYEKSESAFKAIENHSLPYSTPQLLNDINQLEMIVDKKLSPAYLYSNVHPNAAIRQAGDECVQKFVGLLSEISLSKKTFNHLKQANTAELDAIDKRYVDNMIEGFQRSGVNLSDNKRMRIKKLNEELNALGQDFNRNTREDVRYLEVTDLKELKGLPQDYIDSRTREKDGHSIVFISTNYPDYYPLMQYAENEALRLRAYVKFRQRGYPKNEAVLQSILDKRHELAQILGYRNYAHYITEDLMIESPQKAQNFIDKVSKLARAQSDREYSTLLNKLRETIPNASKVGDWQKTYLDTLVKKEKYRIDPQEIRKYFQYDNVKQGIFDLTESLFGVQIRPWETEVWHSSVKSYEILEGDHLVGRFYLDMHPRDGKYKHAAAFGVQDGVKGVQPPIGALVCNFPGGDGSPGYMEHSQVETFLHEFGHLLHNMFGGHQKWASFSGIKTERDFVEAPSQMLEEWVWDAPTLKKFAINDQGEAIPDSLINKMKSGRDYGKGLHTRHQMFYAALSLNYYNQAPDAFDLTDTMVSLQKEYSPFDYVPDTYFHTSFGHLYGYSATYYTYMWSLAIASDMFSEFKKHGLRNTDIAARYREKVLAPGGSKDAADLVEDFLGRPYSFDAFASQFNQTEK